MLLTIVASLALIQVQEAAPQVTAGQIISKMLVHYASANSEVGRIKYTVATGNESISVDTDFAFEKPSLVRIHQFMNSNPPQEWLTVSNGTLFSYNVPPNLTANPNTRLIEKVTVDGNTMSCREIYSASTLSLKDRSMPLDLAFGRSTDLKFRRQQWATDVLLGKDQVRDLPVDVVGGDWRDMATAPVSGTYKMWITEAGDLLRYQETVSIGIPNKDPRIPMMTQVLTSTWDVDIKVNATTDKSMFILP